MKYEPKVLENPTDRTIEFFCGGKLYRVKPKERRAFEGFVAYHALNQVNTGLREVGARKNRTPRRIARDLDLEKMSWKDLRALAGSDYRIGMGRKEVLKILKAR